MGAAMLGAGRGFRSCSFLLHRPVTQREGQPSPGLCALTSCWSRGWPCSSFGLLQDCGLPSLSPAHLPTTSLIPPSPELSPGGLVRQETFKWVRQRWQVSLIYIQVLSGFLGPVEWHFYQNISFGNVSVVFDKSSVTVMATDRREGVWWYLMHCGTALLQLRSILFIQRGMKSLLKQRSD